MVDVPAQPQSVTRAYRTEELRRRADARPVPRADLPAALADAWEAVTLGRAHPALVPAGQRRPPPRRSLPVRGQRAAITACEPPSAGAAEFSVTWEAMGSVSWLTVRLAEVDGERTSFGSSTPAASPTSPPRCGIPSAQRDRGRLGRRLLGLSLHLGGVEGLLSPAEAECSAGTDEGRPSPRSGRRLGRRARGLRRGPCRRPAAGRRDLRLLHRHRGLISAALLRPPGDHHELLTRALGRTGGRAARVRAWSGPLDPVLTCMDRPAQPVGAF